MPALLAKQGLSLGDKDPEMRKYAVERIGDMIRFASEASGMVSLGLVRGRAGAGAGRKEFFKRLAGSFEELLKISLPLEVPLILEPINRYESDHLNSSMEALDFIETDLRHGWELLGEITGDSITDDIITEVFSRFCLGK